MYDFRNGFWFLKENYWENKTIINYNISSTLALIAVIWIIKIIKVIRSLEKKFSYDFKTWNYIIKCVLWKKRHNFFLKKFQTYHK